MRNRIFLSIITLLLMVLGVVSPSAQKSLLVKAVYYVLENSGEISKADLEQHAEIIVVHQFADLKAAAKAGIAIWIDRNAVDQVDHQWLNEPQQLRVPIVLVGFNNVLYSFREVLDAFGIEGPSVDWSNIQVTPGFSVWLWKEHTATTNSAWNKGYNQTATVENIEAVTNLCSSGGNTNDQKVIYCFSGDNPNSCFDNWTNGFAEN